MGTTAINIHTWAFYRHRFSTHLGKYLGEQFFNHMLTICYVCKNEPNFLPKWLYHFGFPPVRVPVVLLPCQNVEHFKHAHLSSVYIN